MSRVIRIGSRESRLAVIQSKIIMQLIEKHCPEYKTELVTMKTTGDKILDRTLDKIGGKGLFVKELDRALIEKEVDMTVHSLKDVPMQVDEGLPLGAFTAVSSPYDVLVLPKGAKELDLSKPIGSSSQRRCIQLKRLFPEAEFMPVRGNVLTRLEKLDRGDYSALVLAEAGLERLGLSERISRVFNENEIIPAAGQGIIAVQTRSGEFTDILAAINDEYAQIRALAERAFVRGLDGGCSVPAAAFAVIAGEGIEITGFYADEKHTYTERLSGPAIDAQQLGEALADRIRGYMNG